MAKFTVKPTGPFRKDLKLAKRRGLLLSDLYTVVGMLENGEPLPEKYQNHLLHGDYKGYWECHINPDWLLLYRRIPKTEIISLYQRHPCRDIFKREETIKWVRGSLHSDPLAGSSLTLC